MTFCVPAVQELLGWNHSAFTWNHSPWGWQLLVADQKKGSKNKCKENGSNSMWDCKCTILGLLLMTSSSNLQLQTILMVVLDEPLCSIVLCSYATIESESSYQSIEYLVCGQLFPSL